MKHSPTAELAFSPNGKTLAITGDDKTVKLWNLETRLQRATLAGHAENVWRMSFSADGKRLAVAVGNDSVKIWDLESQREILTFSDCRLVLFSPDGTTLAVAWRDDTLTVHDATSGDRLAVLQGKCQTTQDLVFPPDCLRLVAVGAGGAVQLWDLETRRLMAQPKGHRNEVFRAVISPDGRVLS